VDFDGCYKNDKKEASFSKPKTRKKSSSTATSLWTLSVRGSQMASSSVKQKTKVLLFGGGQKRSKKKNFDDEIKEREILGSRRLY